MSLRQTSLLKPSPGAPTKRAIIIGAGIGGVTAGFRLQQAGWEVRILERQAFAGGRMKTYHQDGFVIDVGAGILPFSYKAVLKLIHDAGLDELIDRVNGRIGIPRSGKIYYLDMAALGRSLLKTRLVGWRSKVRMLRISYDAWRARNVLRFDTISDAALFDTGSITDYAHRYLDNDLLNYIVGPTIRTLYLNTPEEASIIEFLWAMKNLSSNASFCLKGGMDQLAAALALDLQIDYKVVVRNVGQAADHAVVTYVDASGEEHTESADVAIVATDGKVIADLCRTTLSQRQLSYLSNLRYSTSVNLHFGLTRDPGVNALIIQVPAPVDPHLAAIVLDHLKGPSRAPHGKALVSVFFDDQWGRRMLHESDENIFADALLRIDKIIPGFSELVEVKHIERWPLAATITEPGLCVSLQQFEADMKPGARILFASDLFAPSSVNTCVVQGERAAMTAIQIGMRKAGGVIETVI